MRLAVHPPASVVIVDRGLDRDFPRVEGRDVDYATLRAAHESFFKDWMEG